MPFLAQTKSVIPAKAGTHLPTVPLGETCGKWIPAFAGMKMQKAMTR